MKGNQTESHRRERPMCRSATLQLQPLWTKRNHPPIMSFRANAVSRGIFPSGWFYLVVVLCQTWWIPPLRLRYGRNDITGGRLYGFAYCFQNVSRRPAPSSVSAAPSQLPRRGSFCTVLSGGCFIGTPQESSKKPSPPGKGDRPQAVDEGRYGVVRCRNNGRRG